jgi:hypothetical protein
MTRPAESSTSVLVVTGMHRSGTSFIASVLQRAGCQMGDVLLPGDVRNRPGYFEDVGFLDLNRRMLAATVPADRPGHADWGWTEDMETGDIDAGRLRRFDSEANALIARRRDAAADDSATSNVWGWKDPRTSVLLDFWDARLPDARYVFVYRPPWDVADSMRRLEAEVFIRHPEFAYHIWRHYNEALLSFARRHRDRVLIVSAGAVLRTPGRLIDLVRSRLGVNLDPTGSTDVADPALFRTVDPGSRAAALAGAIYGDCLDLLRDLEESADLPSGDPLPEALVAPPRAAEAQVAIVIPCLDHGAFLLDAIASVEQFVSVPYDLVIVNDGSRDRHTLHVLTCLRRAGYRVVDQHNRGLATARNRGVREAGRRFYVPLDADNRLRPGFVEDALKVLTQDPTVMAVYGNRVEFGLRSGRVEVGVPDLNRLLCGNYIDACAVIRTEAWRLCGGYDTGMPAQGSEDWDLWLSMLERDFVLHRLDADTFDYCVRPDSMLALASDQEVQAAIERYVLAKHAPLYLRHLRRQVDRLEAIGASEGRREPRQDT